MMVLNVLYSQYAVFNHHFSLRFSSSSVPDKVCNSLAESTVSPTEELMNERQTNIKTKEKLND